MTSPNNRHCSSLAARAVPRASSKSPPQKRCKILLEILKMPLVAPCTRINIHTLIEAAYVNYAAFVHPLLFLRNDTLLDVTPVRPLLYNPDLRTNAALLLLLLPRIRPPLAGDDVDANFRAFF
ncbi:hypothetical protein NDU88_003274 [Pleurodeles waltl]|uniref:Uncharacterized protein n=1 Tax=Pleurodeles waltl TaxID=8319 RepID=A0AAV7RI18_PLEWA|nr:hypothetical protein NDU88_003274 [Pleurodeles waltl]